MCKAKILIQYPKSLKYIIRQQNIVSGRKKFCCENCEHTTLQEQICLDVEVNGKN
jgi:hypothetical protein